MTQKTLLNKQFFNFFAFSLKKNLGFTILTTILTFIISPIYLYNVITNYVQHYKPIYKFENLFNSFSCIMAVGIMAFMLIMLYINFNFLYNKTASDFFHALPLKRWHILTARFISCYISALLPLTVGYLGTYALTRLNYVQYTPGKMLPSFLFTALMMFVLGLFSLLFIITSGNVFDSIISILAINIGIPIIATFTLYLCEYHLFGFSVSLAIEDLFSYTTPFGFAILGLAKFLYGYTNFKLFTVGSVVGITLFTIIIAVLAILAYNKRKSEKAGNAYAFKLIPEIIGLIISAIGLFLITTIFSYNEPTLLFWVIGTIGAVLSGVVYYLIINRGFKKIKRAVVVSLLSVIILLAVNFGIKLDIIGWQKNIPEVSEISSVTVVYAGAKVETNNIKLVNKMHTEIVNYHINNQGKKENATPIEFEYTLKNGKILNRYYEVAFESAKNERKEFLNKEFSANLLNEYNSTKENCKNWTIEGSLVDQEKGVIGSYSEKNVDPEIIEKLVLAYIKDVENCEHDFILQYSNKKTSLNCYITGEISRKQEFDFGEDRYYSSYYGISIGNLDLTPNLKAELEKLNLEIK